MKEYSNELLNKSFSDELLEHINDITIKDHYKWPKDLAALLDIFESALMRYGFKVTEAKKLSHLLLAEEANYCGGRHIYIPKGDRLKTAIRDTELFYDWHEKNICPNELATKYRLSIQHVYRIIKDKRSTLSSKNI